MQQTANYNLNKPELSDLPDITQISANFDVIDETMKDNSDGLLEKADKTEVVQNANLNELLTDGKYICVGTLTNAPIANTYCFCEVVDTDDTARILQIVHVPAADNSIRVFVRAITLSTPVLIGTWRELENDATIQADLQHRDVLIGENTFYCHAITYAMRKAILSLFIDVYDDAADVDTTKADGAAVVAMYDSDNHEFVKTTTGSVTFYTVPKIVTSGNASAWQINDWENVDGGSVSVQISRNGGTNLTAVANDTLVSLTGQPAGVSMICAVTLTGKLKFKNIAWGCK